MKHSELRAERVVLGSGKGGRERVGDWVGESGDANAIEKRKGRR